MILGRPTSLWLGFATALTGLIGLVSSSFGIMIPTEVLGAAVATEGAFILLIAGQPPTLAPGAKYHVATPNGQADIERTVSQTREGARATDKVTP